MYKFILYTGGATATSNLNATKDISYARKTLNDNKAPIQDRYMVVDPEAEAELIILDAISGADKSGSTQGLRNANMGRLFGFDTYMSQNVQEHVQGEWFDQTPDIDGTNTVGSTEIDIKNAGSTNTILAGDLIEIDGDDQVYTVTEDTATDGGGDATAKIYPALKVEASDGDDITLKGNHTANLAFHRDAFALVNRPLALPRGGAAGGVATDRGLAIRVTEGYDMETKKNELSFDILYGVKVLEEKLATRVWRQ